MPASRHPDPDFATTLAHGLAVVQCFRVGEPALSNKELAERTGLSKATISRLTYTLAARGFVVFDPHLRRYRLGSTALTIGYPLMASLRVRQLARARMRQLAADVGGSVSLGMRDRSTMVYVETSRGHDLSAWRPDIGATIPLLPTAMGRTWIAAASDAIRAQVLSTIPVRSPAERRSRQCDVRRARDELSELGFCTSEGAWRPDVHAVGVPLRRPLNGEILVFNCGVPAARLTPTMLHRRIGPKLVRLVHDVDRLLESSDDA